MHIRARRTHRAFLSRKHQIIQSSTFGHHSDGGMLNRQVKSVRVRGCILTAVHSVAAG